MNLQEDIQRIKEVMGLNEIYSPSGKEYVPNKLVVHKSNPVWREDIELTGLQVSVGDCYQQHVGGDVECKPAIFATDSLNERDMFDSTYDDDIWVIDTECAEVKWYEDKHFEVGDYKHHILTFDNVPPECIKLIHKGTGKSYSRIKEVVGLNESTPPKFKRRVHELPKYIKSTYTWLNPRAFNSLEEFIKRVVFSSTRDFVADKVNVFNTQEEYDQICEETYPLILQYIEENFLDEIKEYYTEHP